MLPTSLEQELLAHAAALRGLARALVGEHDADDLVQDVAVQALTRAPRGPGPLGAWLAAIVRHLASKHRRAARRRSAREQAVARPEALAPHDEVIAAQDALAVLAQSVLQLPDPYRSAVLLRYFRDLTPAEIAARSGEKIATVKSRLQRGLALLRERLERGSADWRDALVLTFGLDRATASTASIGGVLLMGTGTKLVVGAALMLTAAVLWFTHGALLPWPNATVPPPVLSLAEPAPRETAVPRSQEERLVVTPPDVPAMARVRGRCVDGAGQALGACQVTLAQVPGSAGRVVAWTRERGPFRWQEPAPVVTGPDGGFTLTAAPTGPHGCQLVAAAAGRETARARWAELVAGDDIDVGGVRLVRVVTLRLHVTDGRDAPWPGQTLSFWRQDAGEAAVSPEPSTTVRTDAAGRTVVVLGTGHFRVDHSVPHVDGVDVGVDESMDGTELPIVLRGRHDGDAAIRGTVADPDGAPVPGAFVSARDADGRTINRTRTCGDGSFVLPMPAKTLLATLTYGAPGWEQACTPAPVASGTTDLRLILQRGSAVVVRVCAADGGTPVEDYVLTLWQQPGAWPLRSSRRHPRGEAVLDPVPRGEWLASVVPGDTSLCARYGIPVSVGEIAPSTADVVLPRTARRELRVLRADGSPVAGARVEVLDPRLKRVWTDAPPRARRSARVAETPVADDLDLKSIARPFIQWSVNGPHPDAAQLLLLMTTTTDAGGTATLCGPPDLPPGLRARLEPMTAGPPAAGADRKWGQEGPMTAHARADTPGRGRLLWRALVPGSYALVIGLWGDKAPLLTIPDVQVPAPLPDPRLVDIDLRDKVETLTVQLLDAAGQPVIKAPRGAKAFLAPLDPALDEWPGYFIVGACRIPVRAGPVDLVILSEETQPHEVKRARGHVAVSLPAWPQQELRFSGLPELPAGYSLHAVLHQREAKRDQGRYVAMGGSGGRENLLRPQALDTQIQDGRVSLPIGPGQHQVLVWLRVAAGPDGARGSRQLRGVTPGKVSAGAPIDVSIPAASLETALSALRSGGRKR